MLIRRPGVVLRPLPPAALPPSQLPSCVPPSPSLRVCLKTSAAHRVKARGLPGSVEKLTAGRADARTGRSLQSFQTRSNILDSFRALASPSKVF